MSARQAGHPQTVSAAKAGISERSGREIEQGKRNLCKERTWRTRQDPFAEVWDNELVPMLEASPGLSPITLLEHLQSQYGDKYPDNKLRTLERRIKQWKALHGPTRDVIFRQEHLPGAQGISDFTQLKGVSITIRKTTFKHRLYHFRLSCSGWSHMKVIQGGESYSALAEGLQEALWRLGGAPREHRTDSLSAAYKNLTADEQEDITRRYDELCKHYNMQASRNNRGVGHENGSIESPHGHLKRRIKQGLLLRGNNDFDSVESYQAWLTEVVAQHNRRNASSFTMERPYLQSLPTVRAVDFVEVCARVSSSSTIDVRRATYTVPSQLIGENLRLHLYHDRLEGYLGAVPVLTVARVYPIEKRRRARNVDYRHVIHSLVKKPQAFRFSRLRDDLLPSNKYKRIWQHVEKEYKGKAACKLMVGLLKLAADYECEQALGDDVLLAIAQGKQLSLAHWQHRYGKELNAPPDVDVKQHSLAQYETLVINTHHQQEVRYG